MKRIIAVLLAAALLLPLAACGKDAQPPKAKAAAPAPTAEPAASGPLAGAYVEILKSGNWQYSYIVPYEGIEMTVTEAAANGAAVYRVGMGETGSRIVQTDGAYYAIDDESGQMVGTTAEKNPGGELDFGAMALTGSETKDGLIFETYSMLRNGQPREFTFVFENGALIGLAFSYVEDDAPYFAVTEFSGDADKALFELPDYDAMFEEALSYYDAREYDKSFPLFQALSDAKYAAAMTYLGESYFYGDGVKENKEATLIWYKAAVDLGDPFGQACLADCYCFGYCGVEIDKAKALELYQLSAGAGNAYGMYSLGWVYQHGEGTEPDYALAREWYEKAADAGNTPALNAIGYLYDVGLGVAEDDAEAVRWYARAAEAGHRVGQYNMGLHTYYGQGGLTQDKEKAREYWELSAAQGYQDAVDKLLELYGITYTPESGGDVMTVEDASIDVELSGSSGTITYTGEVDENGLPHGTGTGDMAADADGVSWLYTGAWEHGHLCGQGELTNRSENYVQSGEFRDDVLDGCGTQIQDGVLRYDGQWVDDELQGHGKLYTETGELLYEGEFVQSMRAETREEREKRAAPFMERCETMDAAFYASWKNGGGVLNSPFYVYGSVAAMSEQGASGTVLVCLDDDPDCLVALTYRYAADEPKVTAQDGHISAYGCFTGDFEYTVDGAAAYCPQLEVVFLTTE